MEKGKNKNLNQIKENEIILDIGPNSIKKIKQIIDQSNTVVMEWTSRLF